MPPMLVAASLAVTIGLTAGLIALLMAGMAVGVIVSNRRLAGSCGGTGADCLCEKKERGECPNDQKNALPPGERLVSPDLTRAIES